MGTCITFSNKSIPIAIESNSRREVVFKSGKPLTETNFLGPISSKPKIYCTDPAIIKMKIVINA